MVTETRKESSLDERAAHLVKRMLAAFEKAFSDLASVKDIRGRGLMLAIELDRPCKELMTAALDRGLLINVTAESVIRLLPPLIMTDDEADQILELLTGIVRQFSTKQ